MTSSSSLYGTVTTQNTSSGNSTSLYGEAGTPIPDSSGNVVVRGDLYVLSGNILTTANTGNIFPQNATTINLGLAATAVNIGANTGTTTINNNLVADSADFGNITIGVTDNQTIDTTAGELRLSSTSNAIKLVDTTSIYTNNTSTFGLLNQPTTVGAFLAATSLNLGANTGTTNINNNLLIEGDSIGIAPATTISWAEGSNRLNRPTFQSSTGNTSGIRVQGPNATTSATALISAFNTNDDNNGEFIQLLASNGTTDPMRIRTGGYVAGVFGPTGDKISFYDGNTAYAYANPAGVIDSLDLTTKAYVDAQVSGGVTSITGTADQVIVSTPTGAVTLSLPQSIATTSNVTFADITATDDLTVQGNNVNLAQATIIGYSENNNRANRPEIRSTTGNSSGLRILAPNATTSAISNLTVFGSNDINNGEFLSLQATGSTTAPFTIRTGKYTAGVFGASGEEINLTDGGVTYASINPAGPTNSTDLTTKAYVDAQVDANTTYTINASSTTGGANFNLVGSDLTTDTIKFSGSGATTVTQTSANEINISTTVTDPTKLVNGIYEFTLNADGSVTTPSKISAVGPLTLQGGALDPTTVVVDDVSLVATFDETLPGGDVAVLTATNGSLTWAHTAGAMVIGSEDGTWSLNPDGTTSFPNYTFPYADGSADQVLKTNGSGVLAWYSPSDLNTTYDFNATSATGGANLNLVGSDSTTDTVKLSNGTGVTVSYVSGTEVSVAIGQPVATSDSVTFADVTIDTLVNLNSATLTTSTTAANQVADSFVKATYRTCKYVIQITSGSAYQAVEALVVHDGTTAYTNTYSDVRTGANLTSINAAVNGTNVELQVTPVNAATTYKISKTLIVV